MGFLRFFLKKLYTDYREAKRRYKIQTQFPGVTFEKEIHIFSRKRLFLGKNIYIGTGTILNCGGGDWCGDRGRITIGNNVYIGPNAVFFGAGEIEIHNNCQFGPGVLLLSQSLHPDVRSDERLLEKGIAPHMFAKIVIEQGAMIGAGSIIHSGVTVGSGSIVSTGSIITKNIPPESLVFSDRRLKIINKHSPMAVTPKLEG